MNLGRNIMAGFLGQALVSVISLGALPILLRQMGAEGYGLVGFFGTLQASFALLDLGLTTTVSRETARFLGGASSVEHFSRLCRALTVFFLATATLAVVVLWSLVPMMSERWLKPTALSSTQVASALQLMVVSVAARWFSGFYRGVVTGAERIVWLSTFNALISFFRFVAVFPTMWCFGYSVEVFFWHQVVVSGIELLIVYIKARRLMPLQVVLDDSPGSSLGALKSIWGLSSTVAVTSASWVLVTQADKFVLAGVLPLGDFGYFSLAVALASGIMVIAGPIGTAIMPRMARLEAEGDAVAVADLYRRATRTMSLFVLPAGLVLSLFSPQVLWVWTGDSAVADKSHLVLSFYAVGYALLALTSLAYYLQFAKGELRLHLIGSIAGVGWLVPGVIWSVEHFGLNGPGGIWLGLHLLYLAVWIPVIHRRFLPGTHVEWLARDVVKPLMFVSIAGFLMASWLEFPDGRLGSFIFLVVLYLFLVAIVFFGSWHRDGRVNGFLWG
jgi:O-antigen/teichoic acid export membrane protein